MGASEAPAKGFRHRSALTLSLGVRVSCGKQQHDGIPQQTSAKILSIDLARAVGSPTSEAGIRLSLAPNIVFDHRRVAPNFVLALKPSRRSMRGP